VTGGFTSQIERFQSRRDSVHLHSVQSSTGSCICLPIHLALLVHPNPPLRGMPRKGQKQSRKRKASALAGPAEPAARVTLPTPISAMTDDTGYDHEPEDPVDGHDGDVDDDDEEAYDQDASDQPPSKSRGKAKGEGYQVLPVAELDDDWEGEAEDGATYLALAL
jgi:hypothetical protein